MYEQCIVTSIDIREMLPLSFSASENRCQCIKEYSKVHMFIIRGLVRLQPPVFLQYTVMLSHFEKTRDLNQLRAFPGRI